MGDGTQLLVLQPFAVIFPVFRCCHSAVAFFFFFLCHWICANKWFAALFCSAQFTHTHTRTLRLMPMECGCHCERDLNSDCDCDCAQCMKNDALGHICRELANWTSGALELDGLLRHLAIVVAPL